MSLWTLLLIICLAGAVGGVVNAFMSDNGFVLPRAEQVDSATILRPGYLGNILIGAISAGVSWGLYGPMASHFIAGSQAAMTTNPSQIGLTLSGLVGAVMVGVGGARWLTNEADKKLLKAAASQAASAPATPGAAQSIALSSPSGALNIARGLHQSRAK